MLLESVPNFSEGRDRTTIEALAEALGTRARLLDVHADADHNRSVFTLFGEADELISALLAGVEVARERIDLRRHEGVHPRIGVADVVPVVPLEPGDMEHAKQTALALAERLGATGLPVYLYAELAPGRRPAFFRGRGLEGLAELPPDFGPADIDPATGAVLVGARAPLVAFNVNLRGSLEAAREIASVVRERDGGFPGVRALGLELRSSGLVQVSMNIEDVEAVDLGEIVGRIEEEAAARGAEVAGSELVGLMPASMAGADVDPSRVLEHRLLED